MQTLPRLALAAATLACANAAASHGCTGVECTKEPSDSAVNVLTADNFHRFMKRHPLVLMEFYGAPHPFQALSDAALAGAC